MTSREFPRRADCLDAIDAAREFSLGRPRHEGSQPITEKIRRVDDRSCVRPSPCGTASGLQSFSGPMGNPHQTATL